MKQVITVRLEPEVLEQLDRLAKATARQRSFLICEALSEYLTVNAWHVEAIGEGVRQADAGEVIPHETLRRKWGQKRAR